MSQLLKAASQKVCNYLVGNCDFIINLLFLLFFFFAFDSRLARSSWGLTNSTQRLGLPPPLPSPQTSERKKERLKGATQPLFLSPRIPLSVCADQVYQVGFLSLLIFLQPLFFNKTWLFVYLPVVSVGNFPFCFACCIRQMLPDSPRLAFDMNFGGLFFLDTLRQIFQVGWSGNAGITHFSNVVNMRKSVGITVWVTQGIFGNFSKWLWSYAYAWFQLLSSKAFSNVELQHFEARLSITVFNYFPGLKQPREGDNSKAIVYQLVMHRQMKRWKLF